MIKEILEYIKENCPEGNPSSRNSMAIHFDISQRELREIIRQLNEQGEPILQSNEGYFYSSDPDVIGRVAMRYTSMGAKTLQHGYYLKTIADRLRSQKQQATVVYPVKEEKIFS